MELIEIKALDNGAHRNQEIYGVDPSVFPVPDGWAVIPEDIVIPDTFPFVNITVADSDEESAPFVTSMTAGVVPDPEPAPDPEPVPDPEPTELEQLRADVDYIAMETGVDL